MDQWLPSAMACACLAWAIRTLKSERPAERGVPVFLASLAVLTRPETPGLAV